MTSDVSSQGPGGGPVNAAPPGTAHAAPGAHRRARRGAVAIALVAVLSLLVGTAVGYAIRGGQVAGQQLSSTKSTVWNGDLESGDLSQYHNLNFAGAPDSDRAVVYTAQSEPSWPAPRQGRYAVRLTAGNEDVAPLTPTEDPRAQLDSPVLAPEGTGELWIGWSIYFPVDFPTDIGEGANWYTFAELFGEPYAGSSILNFCVKHLGGVQSVANCRGEEQGSDEPWSVPLQRGRWHDFVMHTKLSRASQVGYLELWYDNIPQLFAGGERRMMEPTVQSGVSDHNFQFNVTNYRRHNSYSGRVTIYQDAARAGRSFEDVAPHADL